MWINDKLHCKGKEWDFQNTELSSFYLFLVIECLGIKTDINCFSLGKRQKPLFLISWSFMSWDFRYHQLMKITDIMGSGNTVHFDLKHPVT